MACSVFSMKFILAQHPRDSAHVLPVKEKRGVVAWFDIHLPRSSGVARGPPRSAKPKQAGNEILNYRGRVCVGLFRISVYVLRVCLGCVQG